MSWISVFGVEWNNNNSNNSLLSGNKPLSITKGQKYTYEIKYIMYGLINKYYILHLFKRSNSLFPHRCREDQLYLAKVLLMLRSSINKPWDRFRIEFELLSNSNLFCSYATLPLVFLYLFLFMLISRDTHTTHDKDLFCLVLIFLCI